MQEDLLQFIWKTKAIPALNLTTTDAEPLEIISFGEHNLNEGPDFLNARIRVGDVEFVGSIEIHVKSSDWIMHRHGENQHYKNVVLHVVYYNDVAIRNHEHQLIPTLQLKECIPQAMLEQYIGLKSSSKKVPCSDQLEDVDQIYWHTIKERLLVERLERKAKEVQADVAGQKGGWEEVFYHYLFRYGAMGVNAVEFQQLAEQVPLKVLYRFGNDVFKIEAILFGVANLIQDPDDPYACELHSEFQYQKQKLKIPESFIQMKFSRMRPANFPTVRLAQLAALMASRQNLFKTLLEAENLKEVEKVLKVDVSPYWQTHYRFGKKAEVTHSKMGGTLISNLIINVVVPFMFAYGKSIDAHKYPDKALSWLALLPSEENRITSQWKSLKVKSSTAHDSQSLIQLYNEYCARKKCLTCGIGAKILNNDSKHPQLF